MTEDTIEKQLTELARGGDRRAFERLFAASQERVLATIGARLSPAMRQHVDPEDVLQDTFIRALHSVERFSWQGQDSFCRWLESIATHVILDAVRHHGRRRALQIDRDGQGSGPSPSKEMRRDERFGRLRASFEAMPPEYQTVLRLARVEGLSIADIAGRMGRSESAVKNLLLRATRQLRKTFGDTESLSLGDRHFEDAEGTHGA